MRLATTLLAATALLPLLPAQGPLPGPTFSDRDIRVVKRGEKPANTNGARVAVVIGINTYAKLEPLGYAEKDAKDLAAAFRSLGFDRVVVLTLDSPETPHHAASILSRITRECEGADSSDTIVVTMSGHGFSDPTTKEGFFCAHYTDPERLAETGLSLQKVRDVMVGSRARQRMLIVDACRNQPGIRGASSRLEIPEAFRAEGFMCLFSTAPGTVSLEPGQGALLFDGRKRKIENGVFTHYLLRGMEGEANSLDDGWLTFRELAYYAHREVKIQTENRQKPYLDWVGEVGWDVLLRQVPIVAAGEPGALSLGVTESEPASGEAAQAADRPLPGLVALLASQRGRVPLIVFLRKPDGQRRLTRVDLQFAQVPGNPLRFKASPFRPGEDLPISDSEIDKDGLFIPGGMKALLGRADQSELPLRFEAKEVPPEWSRSLAWFGADEQSTVLTAEAGSMQAVLVFPKAGVDFVSTTLTEIHGPDAPLLEDSECFRVPGGGMVADPIVMNPLLIPVERLSKEGTLRLRGSLCVPPRDALSTSGWRLFAAVDPVSESAVYEDRYYVSMSAAGSSCSIDVEIPRGSKQITLALDMSGRGGQFCWAGLRLVQELPPSSGSSPTVHPSK